MSNQKKFSFDKTTLVKIGKGALIAGGGAGAIAVLQFIGSADLAQICTEQSAWVCSKIILPFVAFIVPVAINAVKEYIKGN